MRKERASSEAKKRLAEAERDWQQLKKEIAPFVRKRVRQHFSTAGQWQNTRTALTQPGPARSHTS